MRGTTLNEILAMCRSEAGMSADPALGLGNEDYLLRLIRRTVDRLWNDWDWPHLNVRRDVLVQNNQRYYNFPVRTLLERVRSVQFKWGLRWHPLYFGIGGEQYNIRDSDRGVVGWPVYRWRIMEDPDDTAGIIDERSMFEIWPIPNQDARPPEDGIIRIEAVRTMKPLVEPSDRCELDDVLVSLFVAAELLARNNQTHAEMKLRDAQLQLARLKGQQNKIQVGSMVPQEFRRRRQYDTRLVRREGTYPYPRPSSP